MHLSIYNYAYACMYVAKITSNSTRLDPNLPGRGRTLRTGPGERGGGGTYLLYMYTRRFQSVGAFFSKCIDRYLELVDRHSGIPLRIRMFYCAWSS